MKLTVLIATYNRCDSLKRSIESVARETTTEHQVVIIDGGSTDGTIEYLRGLPGVHTVHEQQRAGPGVAYNKAWQAIDSDYTCWLSDDTELAGQGLDLAVQILDEHDDIDMVGLKMKDTTGPWSTVPYMGGISELGVLNCNHAVLRMDALRAVGYFNEDYDFYMIDPDLTASILCLGRKVVMTKQISILHHRLLSAVSAISEHESSTIPPQRNLEIYRDKFGFLSPRHTRFAAYLRRVLVEAVRWVIYPGQAANPQLRSTGWQDLGNIASARFVSILDPFRTRHEPFHLVQSFTSHIARSAGNPYYHASNTRHSA